MPFLISVIIVLFVVVMPAITYSIANKSEKWLSEDNIWHQEVNYLYEYKSFLLNVQQIKDQLLAELSSIDQNNLQSDTFFSPFEIAILKNQIRGGIENLEEMILNQSISAEDFNLNIHQLQKRIALLSLPLASIQHKLGGDYNETSLIA